MYLELSTYFEQCSFNIYKCVLNEIKILIEEMISCSAIHSVKTLKKSSMIL